MARAKKTSTKAAKKTSTKAAKKTSTKAATITASDVLASLGPGHGPVDVGEAVQQLLDQIDQNAETWTGTQEQFDRWQRKHIRVMLIEIAGSITD